MNRLNAAGATVARARERKLEAPEFFLVEYFIAFLNDDVENMKRNAERARQTRSVEDMIWHLEALALARAGRLQEARQSSKVAIDIAQNAGQRERAAMFEAAAAVWEAFYGNAEAARERARRSLELGRGRDVDYAAAFAMSLSGDEARFRALVDELEKNFPEDTSVQYMYLPTLRALSSLEAHDAQAAIRSLDSASRFDLAVGSIGFNAYFGALYPVYVRGEAYLRAQAVAEAAAEYRRILEHRTIVLVDPLGAMARLQLARALALSGDTVTAKSVYADLLTLWKNADPNVPIVEEARAEHARLP